MAATSAAVKPATDRDGKTMLFWRSSRIASRNMISVPTMVRMISGRMRRYSTLDGNRLSGTGRLRCQELHPFHLKLVRIFENPRVLRADWRHETLGKRPHPNH